MHNHSHYFYNFNVFFSLFNHDRFHICHKKGIIFHSKNVKIEFSKKRYKIHILPSFNALRSTHPIAIYHIFQGSCKNTQKRNHIFNKIRKKI